MSIESDPFLLGVSAAFNALEERAASNPKPNSVREGAGYIAPEAASSSSGGGGYSQASASASASAAASAAQAVPSTAVTYTMGGAAGKKNIRTPVDKSCGHCFPPTPPVTGSTDVYVDQFMSTRLSDKYKTHCCGKSCHTPVASQGSSTTFADQLADHCNSHALSCGDRACNGTSDTYAGY